MTFLLALEASSASASSIALLSLSAYEVFVEPLVLTIADRPEVHESGADVLLVFLVSSFLGFLFVLEDDGTESTLAAIVSKSENDGVWKKLVVSKELSDFFSTSSEWKSVDSQGNQLFVVNYL